MRLGANIAALVLALAAWSIALATSTPVAALVIEMDDAAPDRVERQRAFAEGALPLAGTPNLAQFEERLKAKGLKVGDPVFLRIFKSESLLEVWMRRDQTYVLFSTYPICSWSGTLGPKIKEGDKQNPEGFYSVSRRQLHWSGRWPRALDLGYPNSYDRAHDRTGSYLLVHGGCSSVGCYAMTNTVMSEVFQLTEQALKKGQPQVEIHVFPFRMTDANMDRHAASPWADFWGTLRAGYDAFEQTRLPPRIGICKKQYVIEQAQVGEASPVVASPVVKRRGMRRSRMAELPHFCKPVRDVAVAAVSVVGVGADDDVVEAGVRVEAVVAGHGATGSDATVEGPAATGFKAATADQILGPRTASISPGPAMTALGATRAQDGVVAAGSPVVGVNSAPDRAAKDGVAIGAADRAAAASGPARLGNPIAARRPAPTSEDDEPQRNYRKAGARLNHAQRRRLRKGKTNRDPAAGPVDSRSVFGDVIPPR